MCNENLRKLPTIIHHKYHTYLKVCCCQCGAREKSGKYHVDWYRQFTTDVAISNLNVLNFSC